MIITSFCLVVKVLRIQEHIFFADSITLFMCCLKVASEDKAFCEAKPTVQQPGGVPPSQGEGKSNGNDASFQLRQIVRGQSTPIELNRTCVFHFVASFGVLGAGFCSAFR